MRKSLMIIALVAIAMPAFAELQNVQIGGELRIRGNWYMNAYAQPNNTLRWPAIGGVNWLNARSIGTGFNKNFPGILSAFSWDDNGNDTKNFEQRTRLNFKADFTSEVSAFVELDSYDVWGEEFRSNWITGQDFRQNDPGQNDDVAIYQAYIEANNMWGMPLRARIGRQELSFGSEWLVGVNDTAAGFTGLSFDAIRLTYAVDMFSVDAFAAALQENGNWEQDGDVWMYGLYGSYLGFEDITIDAYYLLVRDAVSLNDTNLVWYGEWLENFIGVDDYDASYLNTIGLRGAGTIGAFDFESEVAMQWGDADAVGVGFRPFAYGDDGAEFDAWAVNLEAGYTFDMTWQPRVYLGYAFFEGEDNRDISWWEWVSPFDEAKASVSFNRLFSNWEYTEFFENTDLSNTHIFRAGVSAMPTESVELLLSLSYFLADETFATPMYWNLGGFRVPLFPTRSYATSDTDDELGWELGLYATYHYSEDLTFEAGWAHLFTGDGLTDGNFVAGNGLLFTGGTDSKDADYLFFETKIGF